MMGLTKFGMIFLTIMEFASGAEIGFLRKTGQLSDNPHAKQSNHAGRINTLEDDLENLIQKKKCSPDTCGGNKKLKNLLEKHFEDQRILNDTYMKPADQFYYDEHSDSVPEEYSDSIPEEHSDSVPLEHSDPVSLSGYKIVSKCVIVDDDTHTSQTTHSQHSEDSETSSEHSNSEKSSFDTLEHVHTYVTPSEHSDSVLTEEHLNRPSIAETCKFALAVTNFMTIISRL